MLISSHEELVTSLLHCLVPYPTFNIVCSTTFQALQRLVFCNLVDNIIGNNYCEIGIEEDLTLLVAWHYDTFYQQDSVRLLSESL